NLVDRFSNEWQMAKLSTSTRQGQSATGNGGDSSQGHRYRHRPANAVAHLRTVYAGATVFDSFQGGAGNRANLGTKPGRTAWGDRRGQKCWPRSGQRIYRANAAGACSPAGTRQRADSIA